MTRWSRDTPVACDVGLEHYPNPRHCAATGETCHLGHPANCVRYLRLVLGWDNVETSSASEAEAS